jgi:hypothetical protein
MTNNKKPQQLYRTTMKLLVTWPYGKKTKSQWIQAFEEEAKALRNP